MLAALTFVREKPRFDTVVCGVDEYSLSLGILIGKKTKIPVFCVVEDPPFTDRYHRKHSFIKKKEKNIRIWVVHNLLERCTGVFCFAEKEVMREFNISESRIYQMMNGAPSSAIEWAQAYPHTQEDSREYIIGFVGALTPGQGLETLFEIFAEAKRQTENVRLRLIGPMDSEYEIRYRDQLSFLGLDSRVEVTGWVPYGKMLECLNECSVGVYCNPPTDWFRAAQPLKVCEYLALEKPTVAWDYPGVRRLLDGGRLGVLVPAGDKSAFASALVRLANPLERRQIKDEIRNAVRGPWASDYWYAQVLRILNESAKRVLDAG